MRKLGISVLLLPAFLFVYWCGLYLGDLASIGGYDGFAPEALAREFWYGKYSAWQGVVEIGAKAALAIGPLGAASSLIAALYFATREIVRNVRSVL